LKPERITLPAQPFRNQASTEAYFLFLKEFCMNDFESFTGIPSRTIPPTPEAAGLPSDEEVTQQLHNAVSRAQPFEDEPRYGIRGDGNFDAAYRRDAPFRTVAVTGVGITALTLASS
jgi:hypothetical protein